MKFFLRFLKKSHCLFIAQVTSLFITLPILFLTFEYLNYELKIIEKNKKIEETKFIRSTFESLPVEAKAFVVYDIRKNKVVAEKNADEVMPLASITKVMTAYTALSLFKEDEMVVIHKESLDGSYDVGLYNGQVWNLKNLTKYMLTSSSNDAANAIADNILHRKLFVQKMNDFGRVISSTLYFTSPSGLDTHNISGGEGTAIDVAKLIQTFYKKYPYIFSATTHENINIRTASEILNGVPNTNTFINNFTGLEGSKTGFTDLAGGNLAIIFDGSLGRSVVIVVLGGTKEGRFRDAKILYDKTKEVYRNYNI